MLLALQGVNVALMAYGQTASGKTYTMRGSDQNPGLITLSLQAIYEQLRLESEALGKRVENQVSVSYLEIYNEFIYDLLADSQVALDVAAVGKDKASEIKGLARQKVEGIEDILRLLVFGDQQKTLAETHMNEQSSRSHTIFKVEIVRVDRGSASAGIKERTFTSQLNFVDLAGSEGVSKSNTKGDRLKEGKNINKSLLALSKVIKQLSQNSQLEKNDFVNFRDSKLTRIL